MRKHAEVLKAVKWGTTTKAAEALMRSVCQNDADLRTLMGTRYVVINALEGTMAFISSDLIVTHGCVALTGNQGA